MDLALQEGADYHIEIVNDPQAGGFRLELVSSASRTFCLANNHWPSAGGWMDHQGEPQVWVSSGDRRYPMIEHNMGYCMSDCPAARVTPGQSITAFIPYDRFVGLETPPMEGAELHIRPIAYRCR
ncbi:MAG: hypothetical protein ACK4FB_11920 [Brevundimonas sp.]|uniref:hypothetical protein n=1 Tax=Brevundimonas sp. TaxID=1871086 RepID=UPI00391D004D